MNWFYKFFHITSYLALVCLCEQDATPNAEYCSKDDIQCTVVPSSDQENNYNQYKLQESIINLAFHCIYPIELDRYDKLTLKK